MSYWVVIAEVAKEVGKEFAASLIDAWAPKAAKMVTKEQYKAFWSNVDGNKLAVRITWDLKRSRKYGGKKIGLCKGSDNTLIKLVEGATGACKPDGWAGGHTLGLFGDAAEKAKWPPEAILWMKREVAKTFDGWEAVKFYTDKLAKLGSKKTTSGTNKKTSTPTTNLAPLILFGVLLMMAS